MLEIPYEWVNNESLAGKIGLKYFKVRFGNLCLKISELRSLSLGWLKKKTPQRPSFEEKKDILQQIEMLVCLLSNSHFLMESNNWNPLISQNYYCIQGLQAKFYLEMNRMCPVSVNEFMINHSNMSDSSNKDDKCITSPQYSSTTDVSKSFELPGSGKKPLYSQEPTAE